MQKRFKLLRQWLLFCGDLPMALLMAWLIIIGMKMILFAAFFPPTERSIPHILEGLQYIFLAPLGFLLFRGISDYVVGIIDSDPEAVSTHFLMRIKALIIGLMAAVTATDLLKRALAEEGLNYRTAVCGCLLIVVLAGYSLILEQSAGNARREARAQTQSNIDNPASTKDN